MKKLLKGSFFTSSVLNFDYSVYPANQYVYKHFFIGGFMEETETPMEAQEASAPEAETSMEAPVEEVAPEVEEVAPEANESTDEVEAESEEAPAEEAESSE
jgi:hypothetical protein